MVTEPDSDLYRGLRELQQRVEEAGFGHHYHSMHQSWYERRSGNITEKVDWRGREGKIFAWYSRETPNQDPLHLNDGEIDVNLNPLNPVGEEILGRMSYKLPNTIAGVSE